MILTVQQIADIIKDNPNQQLVAQGRAYSAQLRLHIHGDKLGQNMAVIDGYEKQALRDLRVKYTKSNKDLFARLGRPVDKVFTAKGGSVYYNLGQEKDKAARQLTADVRNGYSAKAWVENYWKPHYFDDPCGLIFMEIAPVETAKKLKNRGKPFAYPTYKSINSVFDYLPKGAGLEYIVFKVDNVEKRRAGIDPELEIYRVVDDAFDYYVRSDSNGITILPEHTFVNLFGEVPGMLNSDILNPNCEGAMLSIFDPVLELASQFLLKGSIKVTHDFLHGFPKYWEYADDCDACDGTKFKDGKECDACKGTGKRIMTRVSDAKLLNYPQRSDDPIVTPNVAGYASPDKIYWEIATSDLQMLEDLANFTLWGANQQARTQGMKTNQQGEQKTATEIVNEIKPQADRLHPISETAEKRDKFIRDSIIRIQLSPNYSGASIN
jgi:hypothetical protein